MQTAEAKVGTGVQAEVRKLMDWNNLFRHPFITCTPAWVLMWIISSARKMAKETEIMQLCF